MLKAASRMENGGAAMEESKQAPAPEISSELKPCEWSWKSWGDREKPNQLFMELIFLFLCNMLGAS